MNNQKLLDTSYNYILDQPKDKDYYTEKVLNKPKKIIGEALYNARINQNISSRLLEDILKNQGFDTVVSYSTFLGIINKPTNYSIDALLRLLDALNLELVVKPKD